jgi:nitrogen regulatory protein P-II 1
MKRVEAISVLQSSTRLRRRSELGVRGMTVTEVRGFGRTGGRREVYRGSAYVVDFVSKIKVEVAVADNLVMAVVDGIEKSAKTGKIGDGKIVVSEILDAVRIRTGERGTEAI